MDEEARIGLDNIKKQVEQRFAARISAAIDAETQEVTR
jgi:hypothetical protein